MRKEESEQHDRMQSAACGTKSLLELRLRGMEAAGNAVSQAADSEWKLPLSKLRRSRSGSCKLSFGFEVAGFSSI